jgi:hypothetical protein
MSFRSAPDSIFLEPQERADAMLFLKFDLEAAAGHDSWITTPAGFMIQINTVHVEAGTDLFDLPFVARQLFVEQFQKIHGYLDNTNRKLYGITFYSDVRVTEDCPNTPPRKLSTENTEMDFSVPSVLFFRGEMQAQS